MPVKKIVLCLAAGVSLFANAQTYQWGNSWGGAGNDESYETAIDASGNVYTAGYYNGTVDFNPAGSPAIQVSAGDIDIFVTKHDAAGNFIWAKSMGGTLADYCSSIQVDSNGDVIIAGTFVGTADFDPSALNAYKTSNGVFDAYVCKLTANGDYAWAQSFGNFGADVCNGMVLDAGDNIILTGYFSGTVDFDPGAIILSKISAGATDVYVSTFDNSGNHVGVYTFGGTGSDKGTSVTLDNNGDILTTGHFTGTIDLDPSGATDTYGSPGGNDIFITKCDAVGNYIWGIPCSGSADEFANSVTTDGDNNVIITGAFESTDFDVLGSGFILTASGGNDAFVCKFDENGNFTWANYFESTGADDNSFCVTTDIQDNIYITGDFYGMCDFDPGSGTAFKTAFALSDGFLVKLQENGDFVWMKHLGDLGYDEIRHVDVTPAGTIVLCGNFELAVDLDISGPANIYANSNGSRDAFTLQMDDCFSTTSAISPVACETYTSPSGLYTHTASTIFTDIIPNADGCDSIITIDLTVNYNTSGTENVTTCDSYFWAADANTYTASGTYFATVPNSVGCDSAITLNLTINNSSTGFETITECDSYLWPANSTTYTASGVYSATLTNVNGCDSVVTLDLTINSSSSSIQYETTCGAYYWPPAGITFYSSTIYNITIPNSVGCDSLMTLDLTINGNYIEQYVTACDSYNWPETGLDYTVSGDYPLGFINQLGCDSIITLHLSVGTSFAVGISLTTSEICENSAPVYLDGYGTPAGGFWSGPGIIDYYFDPAAAGAGTHTLTYTVYDGGCVNFADYIITVNPAPVVSVSIVPTGCGTADGAADATISGGTPAYDIYWNNGASTEDITDLEAGMYFIHVTDTKGCEATGSAMITTSGLGLSAIVTHLDCFGDQDGAIDLDISTSGTVESITWSTGQTTEDLSNLQAGFYEVTVTTTDGCTSPGSFEVTAPSSISFIASSINATCGSTNGTATAVVVGGTAPFDYQWYISSTITPVGTNADNISGVSAGAYFVIVTDDNGCTKVHNMIISETGGPAIVVNDITPAGCTDDGAINISINSSAAISSIDWSSGETTEDISGLATGYYSVQVTDENGCIGMGEAEVGAALPAVQSICLVSVDTNTNTNLLVWEKPVTTNISHFKIYRETSVAGVFILLDSVDYADESVYNDLSASPHIRSWRYKLSAVNLCGQESELSEFHKTIHMTISLGLGNTINLNWDAYEGFAFGTYDLYRHVNSTGWTLLDQLPSTNFSYLDSPPNINGLDYVISITPPSTCTSTTGKAQDHNSSRSNRTAALTGELVSTEENPGDDFMSIYPNPSSGQFMLEVNPETASSYQVIVTDAQGRIIMQYLSTAPKSVIDLSNFSDGIYNMQLLMNETVINKKLVKQ